MWNSLRFRDDAVASVVGSWYTGFMSESISEWMSDYRRAWESNDPADIARLFTEEASYFTEPFMPPARGINEIIATWLRKRDEPGQTTFTWTPLVETAGLAIVQAETTYVDGPKFSNLWVIRLDADGRATEFTEWWMDQSKPA
jgi:ketosteroid isomerase-like protein